MAGSSPAVTRENVKIACPTHFLVTRGLDPRVHALPQISGVEEWIRLRAYLTNERYDASASTSSGDSERATTGIGDGMAP